MTEREFNDKVKALSQELQKLADEKIADKEQKKDNGKTFKEQSREWYEDLIKDIKDSTKRFDEPKDIPGLVVIPSPRTDAQLESAPTTGLWTNIMDEDIFAFAIYEGMNVFFQMRKKRSNGDIDADWGTAEMLGNLFRLALSKLDNKDRENMLMMTVGRSFEQEDDKAMITMIPNDRKTLDVIRGCGTPEVDGTPLELKLINTINDQKLFCGLLALLGHSFCSKHKTSVEDVANEVHHKMMCMDADFKQTGDE